MVPSIIWSIQQILTIIQTESRMVKAIIITVDQQPPIAHFQVSVLNTQKDIFSNWV